MDIAVLAPDVNHSMLNFAVEGRAIRFGLSAVRNVGEGPAKAIVAERANGPYGDIYDFCKRVETSSANARVVESLNKAGAFASTGWNRRQVDSAVEKAISEGQVVQRDKAIGQTSLFDMGGTEESFQRIYEQPKLPEWPDHVIWEGEKEMLGLYISSHPLQNYRDLVERYSTLDLKDTSNLKEGEEVTIAGLVSTVRVISTKKGTKMAFLRLETLLGPSEVTIFSDLYEQKSPMLVADLVVVCVARVNYRDDKLGFVANDIVSIDDAERTLTKAVHVRLHPPRQQVETLDKLALIMGSVPGSCDVYLHCGLPEEGEVVIHAPNACRVSATRQLRYAVEELLGQDTVYFSAGMRLPSHQAAKVYQQPKWKQRAEN